MADLLFVTPLMPFPTGHGSAMRASVALEVLAEKHRVFVLNTEQWGIKHAFDETWVRQRAAGYARIAPRPDAESLDNIFRDTFREARFTRMHVFRLAMAPIAIQLMARFSSPPEVTVLDLDDNEVERTERFLALREESGSDALAAIERAQLQQYRAFSKVLIPRFDVALLATERDRLAFERQFPGKTFLHLRNTVRPAVPAPSNSDPCRLLFVGTLDYLANQDGIVHFCQTTLPLLREAGVRCTVRIVGDGASARIAALARLPEVQLAGFVPELAPEYARAGMAVVPLRAGSGSRIKILEAISYGLPVVSTGIGAEGLGLVHGEHCMLADTPVEFAAACRKLMNDSRLRHRLVENASNWLRETHSLDHARSVLHGSFSSPLDAMGDPLDAAPGRDLAARAGLC